MTTHLTQGLMEDKMIKFVGIYFEDKEDDAVALVTVGAEDLETLEDELKTYKRRYVIMAIEDMACTMNALLTEIENEIE